MRDSVPHSVRLLPGRRRDREGPDHAAEIDDGQQVLGKYLRHAPHELGLTLQPGGGCQWRNPLPTTGRKRSPDRPTTNRRYLKMDDKQRCSFEASGDTIRANQGHSVQVDLQLEGGAAREARPRYGRRFLPSSLQVLVRGSRHHVHLSKDAMTARQGRRRAGRARDPEGDAGRMHRDGHKFSVSPTVFVDRRRSSRLFVTGPPHSLAPGRLSGDQAQGARIPAGWVLKPRRTA